MSKYIEGIKKGDKYRCINKNADNYGAVFEVLRIAPPKGDLEGYYEIKITSEDGKRVTISSCYALRANCFERA